MRVLFELEGGIGENLIVFDDKVVLEHKNSSVNSEIHRDKMIFYSDIESLQFQKGETTNGYIRFLVAGDEESAASDANTIAFQPGKNAEADRIVQYINNRLHAPETNPALPDQPEPSMPNPAGSNNPDTTDHTNPGESGNGVLTIQREAQFFLVNPSVKVRIDGGIPLDLVKEGVLTIPLSNGEHVVSFKMSLRETVVRFKMKDKALLSMSFNRVTGKIEVRPFDVLEFLPLTSV